MPPDETHMDTLVAGLTFLWCFFSLHRHVLVVLQGRRVRGGCVSRIIAIASIGALWGAETP